MTENKKLFYSASKKAFLKTLAESFRMRIVKATKISPPIFCLLLFSLIVLLLPYESPIPSAVSPPKATPRSTEELWNAQLLKAVDVLVGTADKLVYFSMGLFAAIGFLFKERFNAGSALSHFQIYGLIIFFTSEFLSLFFGFRIRSSLVAQLSYQNFNLSPLETLIIYQGMFLLVSSFCFVFLAFSLITPAKLNSLKKFEGDE